MEYSIKIPSKIFISYSHEDIELKNKLLTHLSPLKEINLIKTWHDEVIEPGSAFRQEIDENLIDSDIVLLLISPDYIASYSCYKDEFPIALKKYQEGTGVIIPIILRPVDWTILPIGNFLALPKDGKPITNYKNKDDGFLNISRGIRKFIENSEKKNALKDFQEKFNDVERLKAEKKFSDIITSFIKKNKDDIMKHRYFALYFVDINGLTSINRRYSNEIGSMVLNEIEDILRGWSKTQKDSTHTFRIYGDQYAIFTTYEKDNIEERIKYNASFLQEKIKNYHKWGKIAENLYVTISIGVVFYEFQKEDLCALEFIEDNSLLVSFTINKYFIDKLVSRAIDYCEYSKAKDGKNSFYYGELKSYTIKNKKGKSYNVLIPQMILINDIVELWPKRMS